VLQALGMFVGEWAHCEQYGLRVRAFAKWNEYDQHDYGGCEQRHQKKEDIPWLGGSIDFVNLLPDAILEVSHVGLATDFLLDDLVKFLFKLIFFQAVRAEFKMLIQMLLVVLAQFLVEVLVESC
jgi:hypothetical protein